jgi:hypothetical protein
MLHTKVVHHITDHIAPTGRNGFIPRLLRERAIWAMLGASVALFGFAQLFHLTEYLDVRAQVYPATLVERINQDRTALGMRLLVVSPLLEEAALLKAQDMIAHGYFAHTSPQGVSPWYWFDQVGYTFTYAGENLAVQYVDTDALYGAWLDTPTHQANIRNPHFTEIGIATARGIYKGRETIFVVGLFGTPAQKKISGVPIVMAADAGVLQTIDESPAAVSVKNTDPTIETRPPQTTTSLEQPMPWFSRFLLRIDKHIGTVLEILIIGIILALVGLSTRQWQQHHHKHIAYGVLMVIILTSFLFVGRMGVFANISSAQVQLPYLEF